MNSLTNNTKLFVILVVFSTMFFLSAMFLLISKPLGVALVGNNILLVFPLYVLLFFFVIFRKSYDLFVPTTFAFAQLFLLLLNKPLGSFMFSAGDEFKYIQESQYLVLNGALPELFRTSGLYIWWLNILYWLFRDVKILWSFNILTYFASGLIFYSYTKKVFGPKIASLFYAIYINSPMGLWFANSLYKDVFVLFMISLSMLLIESSKIILSLIPISAIVLTRPGFSILFVAMIFMKTFEEKKQKSFNWIIGILIIFCVTFLMLQILQNQPIASFFFIKLKALGQFSSWNSALIILLGFPLALIQPISVLTTNLNSIYFTLDYVALLEGILTITMIPFAISTLLSRKSYSDPRIRRLIVLWFLFALLIVISGYFFTIRHFTAQRWLVYLIGIIGFNSPKNKKNSIKYLLGVVFVFSVFVVVNYFRLYIDIRN